MEDTNENIASIGLPLFQIGGLWLRAVRRLGDRATAAAWSILDADFSSPWTFVMLAVLAVTLYYAYQLFCAPFNRVKLLGDLGYIPDSKIPMKDIARRVQKSRMVGDVPPVFPNGWFAILESSELKKAQSTTVSCLGAVSPSCAIIQSRNLVTLCAGCKDYFKLLD